MQLIKLLEFNHRYLTAPIENIAKGFKKTVADNFYLPVNSIVHFIGEETILGIERSNSLLRHALGNTYIYHVTTLEHELGIVSPNTLVTSNALIRQYQKVNRDFNLISNIDRFLSNNTSVLVVNYALLPRLYKYSSNALLIYQEWFNIRKTMWNMVNQIGLRREHFIPYKIPQVLPSKSEFTTYATSFKAAGLSDFHTTECFDLLELWRIINPSLESSITHISEDALEHVKLVFVEQGILGVIQLYDLIEWAREDYTAASSALYKFFDHFISLRSPVTIEDTGDDTTEVKVDEKSTIVKLINEHAEAGNLSKAEQNGLLKLSNKYKTIKDPKGSGVTLDKLVVTTDDLKMETEPLITDKAGVVEKSMLHSSLQTMNQKYADNVMHKDLVQNTLMLHNAGIIVKDLHTKRVQDIANKVDEYTVNLQPIAGEASTIKFTIPVIDPDGSFTVGGVKYKLDIQKSELPFVKTKPNIVALTSYYGKVFVTRTESAANNYSRWISKIVSQRATDSEFGNIVNLVYGISEIKEPNIPRAYSAVANTFDSFIVKGKVADYQFLFGFNKISTLFSDAEIKLFKKHSLIPCGRLVKDNSPMGMDEDGKIYLIEPDDKPGFVGTLPYIIDEDIGEGPIEYTQFEIFNKAIPIVIALCFMYGLDATLKLLKVHYTLHPTNIRLPYDPTKYRIKFKDIVYEIDITNKFRKLIIGGFNAIKNDTPRYKGSDFNKQVVYGAIFHGLGLGVYHLKEVKLMWDMFIEPITKGLLEQMGQPTNFRDLLLHASDVLVDDHMPDTNNVRYKGYERMCGIMYRELVNAVRTHRAQGAMSNVGVTLNPKAVFLSILSDQTCGLVEESNPIQNIKEKESFTHVGSGGRNVVTMVKSTRGFTEKDLGVVSEAVPDSAKVGVRAYLTPNANIVSLRGETRAYDPKKDGASSVVSSSALLSPAITHDKNL